MGLSRIVFYFVCLLLAALIGVGFYSYHNLPSLVDWQVKRQLRDYGVQQLSYQNPKISRERFSADILLLNGVYRGVRYEATLSGLEVSYDWQSLLASRARMVTLSELEMVMHGRPILPPATTDSTSTVKLSSWLPRLSADALPLQSIDIERLRFTYLEAGKSPVAVVGKLKLHEQLSLELQASYLGSQLIASVLTEGSGSWPRAKARLLADDVKLAELSAIASPVDLDAWQWEVQGEFDYSPMLSWLRQLQENGALPNLDLAAGLEITGSSRLLARLSHGDELRLSGREFLSRLTGEANTENHLERLDYPGAISALEGDVSIACSFSAGQFSVTIGPTELKASVPAGVLAIDAETRAWLGWGDTVPVRWHSPSDISIAPLQGQSWPLKLRDSSLLIGNQSSQLRLDGLQLDATMPPGVGPPAHGNLRAGVQLRLQQQHLPQLKLVLGHSGTIEQAEFSAVVNDVVNDSVQSMGLILRGRGNLREGVGSLYAVFESEDLTRSSAVLFPLLQHFGLLNRGQSPIISAGKIRLDSETRSRSYSLGQLQQRSHLALDKLSGEYHGLQFEGLRVSADWVGVDKWRTTRPMRFSVDRLNTGVELSNLHGSLSLPQSTPITQPAVRIDALRSQLFGGRILITEPQLWDFAAASNSLTLDVERWKLSEMVALQQKQDIKATGVLEGSLPLSFSGGRVTIADGYLRSLAPGGRIAYTADAASTAMAGNSLEIQTALTLMSDFRYDQLGSEVQLDDAGNLLLELSLVGKNPALHKGRPIIFNINLQQNIDPLLQSMRLSGNLVDKLESRVK